LFGRGEESTTEKEEKRNEKGGRKIYEMVMVPRERGRKYYSMRGEGERKRKKLWL
jgi:hypothetical protein